MTDLRIVDAPVLLQESITDDVKMPTGGLGNYAIRLGDLVWYVVAKERLASKDYVDTSSKGVQDKLDSHITNKNNPHEITKYQVGLGNVDNTADVDKPVSNATKSAIITATTDMATKAYVNQKDNLKADKADTYTKDETYSIEEINDTFSLKANISYVDGKDGDLTTLTTTDKTTLVKAINEVNNKTKGVVALYDKNESEVADGLSWTDNLITLADGSTQRQANDALNPSLNFKYKKPDVLGSVDTSALLQAFVNQVNADKLSRLYIPTVNENYLINNPIICEYPIAIVGDKAPNQNRYMGKNGNILIGATSIAFKFGNGRDAYPEVTYIADQYSVSNIGFLPKNTADEFTKTAIQWYVKTNAPDRGLLLKEVSASRMDKVFHLLSGKETDLANLTVQNSCLSNNNYVIYSEGGLNGLNFINNQAEQNYVGTIYGCFNGAVNIADNMLEGSHNTVTITPVPITGSHLKFNFERNYVEACTGDYLVSLDTTVNGQVTIKDNFHFDLNQYEQSGKLTDIIRLRGVFDYINNVDNFSVTLDSFFYVVAEPRLSKNNDYYMRVNSTNLNTIKNALFYNYSNNKQVVNDTQAVQVVSPKIKTNLGEMFYKTAFGGARLNIDKAVAAGDIVKLTIAYYSDLQKTNAVEAGININDQTLTYGVTGAINIEPSNGVVKVASFITMVGFNATALSVSLSNMGYACYVLNAQIEKIGVSASAEDKVKTYMTLPHLYKASEGLKFSKTLDATSGVEIAANSSAIVNMTIYGLTAANSVTAKLRNPHGNIIVNVESINSESLTVRLFNMSNQMISVTNDILDVTVY